MSLSEVPHEFDGSDHLEFFGRITASISHELNNVMSIIDQSSGLLEDHLAVIENGSPVRTELLERVHEKINRQTLRGVEIIRRLNKFAHSVDDTVTTFDLADITENFVSICQRFAELKRTQLEFVPVHQRIEITSSPFLLQQMLFTIVQHALEITHKNALIQVEILQTESDPKIQFTIPTTNSDTSTDERMKEAIKLSKILHCSMETDISPGEKEIVCFTISNLT